MLTDTLLREGGWGGDSTDRKGAKSQDIGDKMEKGETKALLPTSDNNNTYGYGGVPVVKIRDVDADEVVGRTMVFQ